MTEGKFCFAIDRGGTFTDVWARCPDGSEAILKLLSVDPANYEDAPREAIRRIMEQKTGKKILGNEVIDTAAIDWIRMGTTVATNALLERRGEKMALLITKGFRDLLHISNQARPKIFDLEICMPDVLYEEVVEVDERVVLHQEDCQLNVKMTLVTSASGKKFEVWKRPDHRALTKELKKLLEKGIKSLAVVFIHSYLYPHHEEEVGRLAQRLGFEHISLSSQVMPMVRAVRRGFTASADAYLTPCIKKYLGDFVSGFKNIENTRVLFMQSDGGLAPMNSFNGSRAILSGPAGGVVGYAMTTYSKETNLPVIGFDMGGTSTDVSRFAGSYDHVFETVTAGITIQAPQLDISTVAAGGGSQLFYRSDMFVVGPQSVAAHPGPVCYRKGGRLAVTDANLVLGRLLPDHFPKIFGKTEDQPLDKTAALQAFKKLNTTQVNKGRRIALSTEQTAMGFIRVANEAMCRPIRGLTQAKGYDTSRHVLACFGGAGGQHACAIARSLGMSTVFVHRYAGILSAYGLALADVVHEQQEPSTFTYSAENFGKIDARLNKLKADCIDWLLSNGFSREDIETTSYLHLRFEGTDCALMVPAGDLPPSASSSGHGDFGAAFVERYRREFGFVLQGRTIVVDDIRVRGVGKTRIDLENRLRPCVACPRPQQRRPVYFEDAFHDTPVFLLENLTAGNQLPGPALIVDKNSTIVIEPNCEAVITSSGDIKIDIGAAVRPDVDNSFDPIRLSIFSHRFMSIAEQMGRVLQRTAISTNIKERLDFSCAMFGSDGGLVANAPHIPVHLGAMQQTVQQQIKQVGDRMKEGDVVLSNHPCLGGSHLPDLTVITPVFRESCEVPAFYVASRGHHADIGGATPGSMPPDSKSLHEEGAVFESFFLLRNGEFREAAVTDALNEPARYEGCSGTRNLKDNLSDLRAQVAANQKGVKLIHELIEEYTYPVVQAYMGYIQCNAESSIRQMLQDIGNKKLFCNAELFAEDFMDDGANIQLSISIDKKIGAATFDFSGSSLEVLGNCNAPIAVTMAAVMYCLRCMFGLDIPLNQGCLQPVSLVLPPGCILNPSADAAVVGGNVLTSQRVVDVILKAFGVCAASQGCMNNITFGNKKCGYYETVAGGAGAGPNWHGRSGVHSHMTNTRITDVEILELRYPVVVGCFHLRTGSGGSGNFCGGDGVVRELLFRQPQTLSILTERRVFAPYGLMGGGCGKKGENYIKRQDGTKVRLASKVCTQVRPGETFCLLTPGGGAYGEKEAEVVPPPKKSRLRSKRC